MGRCGSLWVVVDRCGSLWVVPGFSNYAWKNVICSRCIVLQATHKPFPGYKDKEVSALWLAQNLRSLSAVYKN